MCRSHSTQGPSAPRMNLSLSHEGSHCSRTQYPAAATPGPSDSPRAAGDLMQEPGEEHSSSGWGQIGPSILPQLSLRSPQVRKSHHLLLLKPDRHCRPHPWSKVNLNIHPAPPNAISRAGIPRLPCQQGSTQLHRQQRHTAQSHDKSWGEDGPTADQIIHHEKRCLGQEKGARGVLFPWKAGGSFFGYTR